jgi:hypothetical protein
MSDEKPKLAFEKLVKHFLEQKRREKKRLAFKDYYHYIEAINGSRIKIETDETVLEEAARAKVGRFTAHRNQPHFTGDEYHGHCDVGGGHKVAWTMTGKRRHPTKFPARVPQDAKAAVAKVLNVSVDVLESFWVREDGHRVLLFEVTEQE